MLNTRGSTEHYNMSYIGIYFVLKGKISPWMAPCQHKMIVWYVIRLYSALIIFLCQYWSNLHVTFIFLSYLVLSFHNVCFFSRTKSIYIRPSLPSGTIKVLSSDSQSSLQGQRKQFPNGRALLWFVTSLQNIQSNWRSKLFISTLVFHWPRFELEGVCVQLRSDVDLCV